MVFSPLRGLLVFYERERETELNETDVDRPLKRTSVSSSVSIAPLRHGVQVNRRR